jgi:hypothetical protein
LLTIHQVAVAVAQAQREDRVTPQLGICRLRERTREY